jgi:hypothetical protein
MQICRYPNFVKVSLSADTLVKAAHPTYTAEQLAKIKPFFMKALRTCKKYPLTLNGVKIKADGINSWYAIAGSYSAVLAFLNKLVLLEVGIPSNL